MTENGSRFVTYKWLVTTIIASAAGIMLITGAVANTTFYHKADGARTEARVDSIHETAKRIEAKVDRLLEERRDA